VTTIHNQLDIGSMNTISTSLELVYILSVVDYSFMLHSYFVQLFYYLSTSCRQIFRVGTGKARLCKINLEEEHGEFLDWFRPSGE
jgi:hypothetical protein